MGEFDSTANLSLELEGGELASIRDEIESGLSDINVGLNANVSGAGGRSQQPRDPQSGQFMQIRGVEQRVVQQIDLAEQRNALLDDIKDAVQGGGGGAGGGGIGGTLGRLTGGAAGGAGRGIGLGTGGALGLAGLGIGGGIGLLGAGVGAGVGLATGNIQLPEEKLNIELGNIDVSPTVPIEQFDFNPELNPEFTSTFAPEFSPVFEPDFEPVFEPEFTFAPELSPEFAPEFSPVFEPTFNIGDVELLSDIDFSPSITISPTINLTGIDLSGLTVELRDEIINSRQFQNELDNAIDDAVSDIERTIKLKTGIRLP